MIYYAAHHEICKDKWDHCIDEAGYSIIYAYSWYLDAVSPGWDALIEDDYESVFPLTWKKKYGLFYLSQPKYAQQLGIFSKRNLSDPELNHFIQAIPKKFLHGDINLNPANSTLGRFAGRVSPRKTYHLSLRASYPEIYQNYSKDTKRNLKRIGRQALRIETVPAAAVIDLYQRNVWHKTPGLALGDFRLLNRLTNEVKQRKECLTLGVFDGDTLSAGAIFFISQEKIIFIFGAADKTGRKNGAMRFMLDWMVQTHSNKPLVLDFEGSSVDSVEYFYKSFGPERIGFVGLNYTRIRILKMILAIKKKFTLGGGNL